MRILAWCVMPNHWHLLLWPQKDGDLSNYMRLVTLTHTQRLHAHRASAGTGHIYQGRFKSFAVQSDQHFVAVSPGAAGQGEGLLTPFVKKGS